MDWIRLKIAAAIGGDQPINKKLVLGVVAVIAAATFLINAITTESIEPKALNAETSIEQVEVRPANIYVHIIGEVGSPGIYQLDAGSRVVDAVFAAGGFSPAADQGSVNLAREITDGEQVIIFKIGTNPQLPAGSAGLNSAGISSKTQISLNRASQAELEQLPGVGPALAGRMIDWRTANGGFKKKEDLLNISGIGEKLFSGIKNDVTL